MANVSLSVFTSFILFYVFSFSTQSEALSNIQSQGSGFCFQQIPRKSIAGRCSEDDYCRELVNHPVEHGVKCGVYGECIVQHPPQDELCRSACETGPCGKFCLQEHETKVAQYCIKARDHPNALPSGAAQKNEYYCVCTVPDMFIWQY